MFVYLHFSLYSLFLWELDLTLLGHLAGQLNLPILFLLEEVSVTYNNLRIATNVIQFSLFISGKMTLMKPLNAFQKVNLLLVDPLGYFFTLSDFVIECNPITLSAFIFSSHVFSGIRSRIDVGVITGESAESHYFINVADVHL